MSIDSGHRKLFSPEIFLWVLLATWQVTFRIFSYSVGYDHVLQAAAGLNLLHGHGLGQFAVSVRDLSKPVPHLMSQWPPGFALFFDAFFLVLRDQYLAMVMTDVSGVLSYLAGSALLCWCLRDALTYRGRIVFAVVSGLLGFPVYGHANIISVGLMMIALGLLIPPPGKSEVADFSVYSSGILFAALVPFRYAFVPISLAPAAVFLWEARRDSKGWNRLGIFLSGWILIIIPFLWWKFLYVSGGVPGSFRPKGTSLSNLKNLLWLYPFGSDALTAHRVMARFPQFCYHSSPWFSPRMFILRHIISTSLVWAAIVGAYACVKEEAEPTRAAARLRFFRIGLALSLGTVALLTIFTVLQEPMPPTKFSMAPVGRSVWVEISRYWLPLHPILLMGLVFALVLSPKGRSQRVARVLVSGSLVAAFAIWMLFFYKLEVRALRPGNVGGPFSRYYPDKEEFNAFLAGRTRKDMPNVIALCGTPTDGTYLREAESTLAGWASVKVRKEEVLRTSRPVNFVAFLEPAANDAEVKTWDSLCLRMNAPQERMGDFLTCSGTFVP